MRFTTSLRAVVGVALAGGLRFTVSCKKNEEVAAVDVVSAQDAGLGDEENAATADLVEAAAPQDATATASATVVDAPELARLLPLRPQNLAHPKNPPNSCFRQAGLRPVAGLRAW